MPFWLNLSSPDEVFRLFFGRDRIHGQRVFHEEDEVYMARLSAQNTSVHAGKNTVVRVQTPEEFALWTKISNDILAGGLPDIHPVFHYPLCREGQMKCYILYADNEPFAPLRTITALLPLSLSPSCPECGERGMQKPYAKKPSMTRLQTEPKSLRYAQSTPQ